MSAPDSHAAYRRGFGLGVLAAIGVALLSWAISVPQSGTWRGVAIASLVLFVTGISLKLVAAE